MYNILIISPISIAGTITMRGLSNAFNKLGYTTLLRDVRELNQTELDNFQPDFCIGYDYAHLVNVNNSQYKIENLCKPIYHWFLDNPYSTFSHSGDLTLYDDLELSGNTVFCWDKDLVKSFKNNEVYYLPVGIDLNAYPKQDVVKWKMISFVGRPLTKKRQDILFRLVKDFPDRLVIFCHEEHFRKSVYDMWLRPEANEEIINAYENCYRGYLKTEEEIAKVFQSYRVNLNITMDQSISSMNNRVLEVLSSGNILLTDYMKDIEDNFEEYKDFIFYENINDLVCKLPGLLGYYSHPPNIGKKSIEKIKKYHTMEKRAKKIIEIYEEKDLNNL